MNAPEFSQLDIDEVAKKATSTSTWLAKEQENTASGMKRHVRIPSAFLLNTVVVAGSLMVLLDNNPIPFGGCWYSADGCFSA